MRQLMAFIMIATSFSCFAQSSDEIIARHLEQYGQPMWDQIQTLQISGKHVTEDYEAFPINVFIKDNNQVRVEGLSSQKGYILILNHEVFWSSGNETLNLPIEKQILYHALTIGSPVAKFKDQLDFLGLSAYQGATFFSFIKKSEQIEITYLIDKENYELRHINITTDTGERSTATLTFDKYKSIHGLLTPIAVIVKLDDQYREWVFNDILLGVAIADKIFEKPVSH